MAVSIVLVLAAPAGAEAQLSATRMFYKAADAVEFVSMAAGEAL